jgi:predicted deacylase
LNPVKQMTMEFCRFRDFVVPHLGLSTRHPSIHEMHATRLVDSSFRAPHLPDDAGTRLYLGRTILRSILDRFARPLSGRCDFVADAHRDDGKRLVVRADEKLTAFLELERVARGSLLFQNAEALGTILAMQPLKRFSLGRTGNGLRDAV